MSEILFQRLKPLRVSATKRGAALPATTRGPLTGLVAGAVLAAPLFERRALRGFVIAAADPLFERRALRGFVIAAADPLFERRALRGAAVAAADPLFEARHLRPGAPAGATLAVMVEKRWPTVAGTPFEFTLLVAGRATIRASNRACFQANGEKPMTRDEQLALNGAFITIEGQRRQITAVRLNEDGSCDLAVRPPIAMAAPVEVFEPLAVKGSATVIADTTVRFVPAKDE